MWALVTLAKVLAKEYRVRLRTEKQEKKKKSAPYGSNSRSVPVLLAL